MSSKAGLSVAGLFVLALFVMPWVPVGRTAKPRLAEAPRVRLLAVGDVTFGRFVGAEIEKRADFDFPLRQIAPALLGADLALANLEGPLLEDPPPYEPATAEGAGKLLLIGDARAAQAMARAGLRVAVLANNHVLDGGPDGLRGTIRALRAAGVVAVGAGEDEQEARRPATIEAGELRVALLARSAVPSNYHVLNGGPLYPGPAYVDAADARAVGRLEEDIRAAQADADLVVLAVHWGREYTARTTEGQRTLAEAAARAGADLVIGAHPHVAQPLSLLPGAANEGRGTFVAYSLGNAVFDQFWMPEVKQGLALSATLGARGVEELQLLPLPRTGYDPRLAAPNDPAEVDAIARVYDSSSPEVRQLVLSAREVEGRQESYQLLPALGYSADDPRDGRITTDLAGDGTIEEIALRDGQLVVRRQEPGTRRPRLLWATPLSWRVDRFRVVEADELAANGRELAFTVWKPSVETEFIPPQLRGRVGQHFFLYAEREGAMRPAWNSSILPAPILDFDFAPGPPARLVTLEGRYDEQGAVAVAVWGWMGFGYGLEWRSPALVDREWGRVGWRGAVYVTR